MCGISGVINTNGEKINFEFLKKITDSIEHRGPDGEGFYLEGNVGIGHKRLSILDLSKAGTQPMKSLNKRYVISYNGEIYNFRTLRQELIDCGVEFISKTDTEVVLNSLIYWGYGALHKFNGMFALAFWDNSKRELLLARDRYGIKPLYYAKQNQFFYFGSEQKVITTDPNFRREIDNSALYEYFTFQNIFTDKTLFKNIFLLPAGHYGLISFNENSSRHLDLYNYWDYKFEEPSNPKSRKEYLEELDRLFKQAIKRQLISDVEIGAYLSGGIDSGAIVSTATKSIKSLKTFTCGFDLSAANNQEVFFDERQQADLMSAIFQTEHYQLVIKSGDMERCLDTICNHIEEPRVGQSYPNYYAARLASKFVKVVLSGSGGDELFGGYPWRYYRTADSQSFDDFITKYFIYWQRLLNGKEIKKTFRPIFNDIKEISTREIFKNVFINHENELSKPEDYINHSLYFEAKTFLHGLFMVEDKLSMAHGLENRVPFMDNDLVDFAMKCPVNLKLNNLSEVLKINENHSGHKKNLYYKKTNDGKQILRDMLKSKLPFEITSAKKQGFSAPDASWFRSSSIEFVKNKLFNKNTNIYNFLDYENINLMLNEHLEGKKNRRLLIWSLLNFESWLRLNL